VSVHFAAGRRLLFPARRARFRRLGLGPLRDLLVQLLEVADRLLEDMPQDLHVDELRGRPRRNLIVQGGRPVFLGGQAVQALADVVGDLQPVQESRNSSIVQELLHFPGKGQEHGSGGQLAAGYELVDGGLVLEQPRQALFFFHGQSLRHDGLHNLFCPGILKDPGQHIAEFPFIIGNMCLVESGQAQGVKIQRVA
jgi:hypothetical protein